MSYNYLASQVPAPTTPGAVPLESGCNSTTTTAKTFLPFPAGAFRQYMNQAWAQVAAIAGYGGKGCGIIDGLALSTSLTLNVGIAAGHLACVGSQESGGGNMALPGSQAKVFCWMYQNGTFDKTTTTAPPVLAAKPVFIGTATTSGSAVTAVDFSGVCYMIGDSVVRFVADPGMPGDTPPSEWRGWTINKNNIAWWWNGTGYLRLGGAAFFPTMSTIPSGVTEHIPAGFQQQVFGHFVCNGHLVADGQFRVTN